MNSSQQELLALPLTEAARQTAERFAREQPTPQKAEQVRLNTLAVWAVNDYLQLMDIPTDLTGGDSWNPIMRLCADVADLTVSGVGCLECRPVGAEMSTFSIPPEVWEDRIGYVAVQIDGSLREATLLGFAPTMASDEFAIARLQPLEALLVHLDSLRQSVAETQSATLLSTAQTTVTNLRQWLQGVFEAGWQTFEDRLDPPALSPAFSFRQAAPSPETTSEPLGAGLRRAKLIELGRDRAVWLVVELSQEGERTANITLQVHPTQSEGYLPPDLQLRVLDGSGAVFLESRSRQMDRYIQLYFRGQAGEQFTASISLDDVTLSEDFAI